MRLDGVSLRRLRDTESESHLSRGMYDGKRKTPGLDVDWYRSTEARHFLSKKRLRVTRFIARLPFWARMWCEHGVGRDQTRKAQGEDRGISRRS